MLLALVLLTQTDAIDTIRDSPFSVARPSFFGATVEVPPLENARTLTQGAVYLRLRALAARSDAEEGGGHLGLREDNFDGTYEEFGALLATWAPWRGVELSGRVVYAGWDEKQDRFRLFDDAGRPIVQDEDRKVLGIGATHRHANLSVFGFGVKKQFLWAAKDGVDLSAALSVKVPAGRETDITHSGTTDVALAGLLGIPLPWGCLHAQLGFTVPFGEQTIFEDFADVDANPFAFAAVGTTWQVSDALALGVQLEANTSAFRDVDFLDGTAIDLVVGARWIIGRFVLEVGGGGGLDWSSSYQYMGFLSLGYVL